MKKYIVVTVKPRYKHALRTPRLYAYGRGYAYVQVHVTMAKIGAQGSAMNRYMPLYQKMY
jgi:hypothetical protein